VLGAPSASAAGGHDPARWHGLEMARQGEGWSVRVVARGLAADGSVEEKGRYLLHTPQR
jgi:hypothetical protein